MLQAAVEALQMEMVGRQYDVVEVNGELGIGDSLIDVLLHEISYILLAELLPVDDSADDMAHLSAFVIPVQPKVQCHLELLELVLTALLADVL